MQRLRITALTGEENIDLMEAKILFFIEVLSRIEKTSTHGFLSTQAKSRLTSRYEKKLRETEEELAKIQQEDPDTTQKLLSRIFTLHSLEIERSALFELFSHNELSERLFRRMLAKIESQIARVDDGQTQIKDAFEQKK